MQVLFVTPNYPTSQNPSNGIFVRELAEALCEEGTEVRVAHMNAHVIWPFSLMRRYRNTIKGTADIGEVPLVRHLVRVLPKAIGKVHVAERWGKGLLETVRHIWPEYSPDIIHAHTIVPGVLSARAISTAYECPLIVTTHGADTRFWLQRPAGRRAILDISRQNVPIICVSDVLKQRLERAGAGFDSLFVISNGIDVNKLHSGYNPLREKYIGKTVILGVGNLKFTKGFDLFLHAVASLKKVYPRIQGVIVGDGADRNRLLKLHRHLALDSVVEFVGAKNTRETMAYMDACDIFCLPSWSEGFGIVYIEAMAHGKPVIAVEGQGISEFVNSHNAGLLVPPHDIRAVVHALRKFLIDPDKRRLMGVRGQKAVFEHLSWKDCAENTTQLYHKIINSWIKPEYSKR